jgi:hypothetical protein
METNRSIVAGQFFAEQMDLQWQNSATTASVRTWDFSHSSDVQNWKGTVAEVHDGKTQSIKCAIITAHPSIQPATTL